MSSIFPYAVTSKNGHGQAVVFVVVVFVLNVAFNNVQSCHDGQCFLIDYCFVAKQYSIYEYYHK